MLVGHSDGIRGGVQELQAFLNRRFYRHPHLLELARHARVVLSALFAAYCDRPGEMPPWYRAWAAEVGINRAVCDYLAGMTDRFAQSEYQRLVGALPRA
jgi:dGTPase